MSWGISSKLFDAVVKFFSLPLLISYLGSESFGLIVFVFAINSYSQILGLGVNTGAVKFFSEYIQNDDQYNIRHSIKVNLGFYILIGLINCLIYLGIFLFPAYFNISDQELNLFKNLILCSMFFVLLNWINNTFDQIITSRGEIIVIHKINNVKSFLYLIGILAIINFELGVLNAFIIISLANSTPLLFNTIYVIKKKFAIDLIPSFNFRRYKSLFIYSSSIFIMGVFQMTTVQAKPIILKLFNPIDNNMILTEYRVLEIFPLFLTSIGGLAIGTLLPLFARLNVKSKLDEIKKLVLVGTTISSFVVCIICFPLIELSNYLIYHFVGSEFLHISIWLKIWFFTVMLFLHNIPFATYILATGKTKDLVLSSAIGCFISIFVNIVLIETYGVGSAIISYLVYIIFQMSYYYIIIIKSVGFDSKSLLIEFLKFFILGLCLFIFIDKISFLLNDNLINSTLKVIIYIILYYSISAKFKWLPKLKNIL
jgi:O-antigen/teichoic acid export membrane protein